jgi:hypothetical protein
MPHYKISNSNGNAHFILLFTYFNTNDSIWYLKSGFIRSIKVLIKKRGKCCVLQSAIWYYATKMHQQNLDVRPLK